MKTNGSQSSHIQVDRHTIETALDDEVAASFPNNNNCNEGKTCHSSRVKRRKLNGKMPTNATATTESEPDLLDILDNFLISTSNAEHAQTPPPEQQRFISSHPRPESITNVSSPVQQMLPPRFELGETDLVPCHIGYKYFAYISFLVDCIILTRVLEGSSQRVVDFEDELGAYYFSKKYFPVSPKKYRIYSAAIFC